MVRTKTWTDQQLITAVSESTSVRQILKKIGLVEAGGNYVQIQNRIKELKLKTEHLTGKGWNVGLKFKPFKEASLKSLLVKGSNYQSHKLKRRLFRDNIKKPKCELCGWNKESIDGRIPVELDHVNGDKNDNRLKNLRILCPNCHSLQLTHRGKNKNRK